MYYYGTSSSVELVEIKIINKIFLGDFGHLRFQNENESNTCGIYNLRNQVSLFLLTCKTFDFLYKPGFTA
jgi:hypothetical protein